MSQQGNTRIKRLLVANRGEIATRILSAARELEIETFALYTKDDSSHTYNVDHAIELSSASAYLDIDGLLSIAKEHHIDAIHPGYGFLSESADLARRMRDEAGVLVIGPSPQVLARTGDKLQARELAIECHVPVLPALTLPTNDVNVVQEFATKTGYPIMIKAVDGGGGRGIRLVTEASSLDGALRRAVEESPSRQVFAEKAAISGYRHVEVQIIGDGQGNITHLWERECSIQRRYQKVVEQAPSSIIDRRVISEVIEAALRMAEQIHYSSLGTFEFLVNPETHGYFFMEINPRLQVEHTVTESICQTDIVRAQLLIAQGHALSFALGSVFPVQLNEPPQQWSVQFRITAEDPEKDWSLSVGKIQSFHFPSGNGVRIDSNLIAGATNTVSSDFDSLIAKLIVTGSPWTDVVSKAKRTLSDVRIVGVKTNLAMLRAIVSHPDFVNGTCDTRWLEDRHSELLSSPAARQQLSKSSQSLFTGGAQAGPSTANIASSSVLFRKDDAWAISLTPKTSGDSNNDQARYHLGLTKVLRNDFPNALKAEISFTAPDNAASQEYVMDIESTTASASAMSSSLRRGDPRNPAHLIVPFSGKLIEVLIDEGDDVRAGDTVAVVRQMKMEVEVRATASGRVEWVADVEDGEDVGEGVLLGVLDVGRSDRKGREVKL